jgi:hypothetical protein
LGGKQNNVKFENLTGKENRELTEKEEKKEENEDET